LTGGISVLYVLCGRRDEVKVPEFSWSLEMLEVGLGQGSCDSSDREDGEETAYELPVLEVGDGGVNSGALTDCDVFQERSTAVKHSL